MVLWWKKRKFEKESTVEEKQLEIKAKQPGSLLQAFIQYVEQHKKDELKMSVGFSSNGVLTLTCQFENEKNYTITLKNDTPLAIQRNPELMILKLYENEHFNKVIQEFHRMERVRQELDDVQEEIDSINLIYKDKNSATAHTAIRKVITLTNEKRGRQEEHDRYMKKIWFYSPYMAERLHAIYKEFMIQHTQRQTADPVEVDLLSILDDKELSVSTKQKAEKMLSEYREQKARSSEDKVTHKENQALLTLSTIERHYLKGGEGVE